MPYRGVVFVLVSVFLNISFLEGGNSIIKILVNVDSERFRANFNVPFILTFILNEIHIEF
jgi:hypothetical protein